MTKREDAAYAARDKSMDECLAVLQAQKGPWSVHELGHWDVYVRRSQELVREHDQLRAEYEELRALYNNTLEARIQLLEDQAAMRVAEQNVTN